MEENVIAKNILNHSFDIHKALGPGLLESVYQSCLKYRLEKAGFIVKYECPMPVIFEEVRMECGYRADLIVNEKVIVEVKSVSALIEVHTAQLLTYLKLSGCKLGLLLNFNEAQLKNGIKRMVNGL